MGKQELDILVHTFYNLYSLAGRMVVISQLSIALKMGRACSGGRDMGTGCFVCADCFVVKVLTAYSGK